ncbi:MAG: MFS transporter [Alphaproteobacteria bacterium]
MTAGSGPVRGLGPTSLSAAALSIVLMGDALLYVVLPVSAADFGVSIIWVGILLSANRFVRIVSYGAIARVTDELGIRRTAILGCATGAASTVIYGLADGGPALLAARLLWGLSYAALILACLAYAVDDRERAGTRVGLSHAIQQFGPAAALTGGAWLAGYAGPQVVFLYLGILSFAALPVAFLLPRETGPAQRRDSPWLPRPERLDLLFFAVGLTIDGAFTMTITILLSGVLSIETAILGGGLIFLVRRFAEAFLGPLGGMLGDRVGVGRTFFAATMLSAAGLSAIALGHIYAGAVAVVVGRAIIAAVGPAAVALRNPPERVMHRLATMQSWRDLGAALGPLASGFVIGVWDLPSIYWGLAVLLCTGMAIQALPRR